MITHYVQFFNKATSGLGTTRRRIESPKTFNLRDVPPTAYGWQFYCVEEQRSAATGNLLTSGPFNFSRRYLYGEVLTADEIRAKYPDDAEIVRIMAAKGWPRVVRNRFGGWLVLAADDLVKRPPEDSHGA